MGIRRNKTVFAYRWHGHPCMKSKIIKKKWYNELIYKIKTDSRICRMNLWLPKRKGRGKGLLGSLGLTCTYCYKMDNQEGPTV